jgi:Ca-activated chloride channel family protein
MAGVIQNASPQTAGPNAQTLSHPTDTRKLRKFRCLPQAAFNYFIPLHTQGTRPATVDRPLSAAILLLGLITTTFAQSPTPASSTAAADSTPTIEVDSRIVAVSAVVRDKAGQPLPSLARSSFLLKQDGKPQAITYFSQGSELPLTLALLVDTSGSQRAYIRDEIAAGKSFFPAMMSRPDDRAVLVQFDSTILQLAKITGSVTALEHSLAYLTQSHDDITGNTRSGGGTLLFDAICAVSRIELGTQVGRRAMVILTDGGDNGSRFNAKDAIRSAEAADISIYTVYYSNGGGEEDVLKNLSKQTGGREFSVNATMSLEQIYAAIAADLRLEYEIGYRPPDSKPGKYHKIDLQLTDKSLAVQAREGYFTPAPK